MVKPSDVFEKLLDMFNELVERMTQRRDLLRRPQSRPGRTGVRPRQVSALLRQLKRGELTLDEFLSEKVDKALAPLRGLMDQDDIGFLRALVLERCEDDPILSGLVARIRRSVAGGHRSETAG